MSGTIILKAGEGRRYELGRVTALFLADEEETSSAYSVSQWWMEPGFEGVGAHLHEANDEIFQVLEGTAEILVGEAWLTVERGTFLRIPAGTTHDFRNRSSARAGLFNVFIPGGFERNMPEIAAWFKDNPG